MLGKALRDIFFLGVGDAIGIYVQMILCLKDTMVFVG